MNDKKTKSAKMSDEEYNDLCEKVPDVENRYERFISLYYKEKNSGLKKQFRTSWRKLVLSELPTNLSVDEWLSLAAAYKKRIRHAQKTIPEKENVVQGAPVSQSKSRITQLNFLF
jgi:hypothetical protein